MSLYGSQSAVVPPKGPSRQTQAAKACMAVRLHCDTRGVRVPLQVPAVPAVLRPVCRTDALGEVYAHLRSAATEHPNDLQGTA